MKDNKYKQEISNIHKRYANRPCSIDANLYSMLRASFYMEIQERERAMIKLLSLISPLDNKKILEIGCGNGDKILQLLNLGFEPSNIIGNDLLPDATKKARSRLPSAINIIDGDATKLDFEPNSFDIVYQSTVFSSILDDNFQKLLANKMWQWVKPGGGILWYDFTYNNPANPDVRGVPVKRIQELFPHGKMKIRKVTLAPPINRLVTKIHPSLYTIFNALPFLRTHVICWIGKA